MKKLSSHWNSVNENWRHIIGGMTTKKEERIIKNYKELFLGKIDKKIVSCSLDWGCGGGLLTAELAKDFKVCAVDISEKSLNSCINYALPEYTQLILDDIDSFVWNGPKVDFILCHALVWHFPSLEYFKKVLYNWKLLSPTYIAFNTKPSEISTFTEPIDYSKDFLNSLFLNDDFVITLLAELGYTNISKVRKKGHQKSTFFVFKKIK